MAHALQYVTSREFHSCGVSSWRGGWAPWASATEPDMFAIDGAGAGAGAQVLGNGAPEGSRTKVGRTAVAAWSASSAWPFEFSLSLKAGLGRELSAIPFARFTTGSGESRPGEDWLALARPDPALVCRSSADEK